MGKIISLCISKKVKLKTSGIEWNIKMNVPLHFLRTAMICQNNLINMAYDVFYASSIIIIYSLLQMLGQHTS